jgi:hypothetical protein
MYDYTAPVRIAPGERGRSVMPHSEVMIHMRLAGQTLPFTYRDTNRGVQVERDGQPFSFPVSPGEAGIYFDAAGAFYYPPLPPSPEQY